MKLKIIFITLLFSLCSCAHFKEKQISAQESWQGHKAHELVDHPYFKKLPLKKLIHKDKSETWLLKDSSKFQTSAYCQSLGGCIGIPTYDCENLFKVKDGIIISLEQKGSCPSAKTIEASKKLKE